MAESSNHQPGVSVVADSSLHPRLLTTSPRDSESAGSAERLSEVRTSRTRHLLYPPTPMSHASTLSNFLPRLLKAVWLSILLGIFIQLIVMLVASAWPKNLLAETAQKVSWSVLVCSALAIGNALAKARSLLVGLVGLLAAPAAFHAARTIQKSLAQGAAGSTAGGVPTPTELAIAKAIQYAIFGACIAWASRKGKLSLHVLVGVAAGLAMAIYLSARLHYGNDPAVELAKILPRSINELIFPIGCAFVLWTTAEVGKRIATAQAPAISPASRSHTSAPVSGTNFDAAPSASKVSESDPSNPAKASQ